MNDQRFDKLLREAAEDYNRPPETPKSAMWEEIQKNRGGDAGSPPVSIWRRPLMMAPLAAAAIMIIGFGIGRWSAPEPLTPQVAMTEPVVDEPAPTPGAAYFRAAAGRHLQQTETLLTMFALEGPTTEGEDRQTRVNEWSRKLLSDTRLLMDSPAADDPALQQLLADLELYLARIVQLSSGQPGEEKARINDDLRDRGVLMRLRSQLPAGHV